MLTTTETKKLYVKCPQRDLQCRRGRQPVASLSRPVSGAGFLGEKLTVSVTADSPSRYCGRAFEMPGEFFVKVRTLEYAGTDGSADSLGDLASGLILEGTQECLKAVYVACLFVSLPDSSEILGIEQWSWIAL